MSPETDLSIANRTTLLAIIANLQATIAKQEATIAEQSATIAELQREVEDLKGRILPPGKLVGMPGNKITAKPPKPRKKGRFRI